MTGSPDTILLSPAGPVPGLTPVKAALWRRHLSALAAVWLLILLRFYRDAADMVALWWSSSTYGHCLFLVPIIGWLVHQRRAGLRLLEPTAWWPGLLWGAGGGLLWLLGELGGIALFRHTALIVMLQAAVAAVLGPQLVRGLLFPLFYMVFLIPFGEELVPPMQTITARLSMLFLGWTGIPAHLEGVFITTPHGYFKVAEACSGVKFLIAMAAYAVLVTNLCFKSWARRIAFLTMALIVPVIANGIRAFGTIWIAERTGIAFAANFDHIVYGWFFFGAVMLLVMAIGWRFFDRRIDDPMIDARSISATRFGRTDLISIALGGIGVATVFFLWNWMTVSPVQPLRQTMSAPKVSGWEEISPQGGYRWRPRFDKADRYYFWRYRRNRGGEEIDLAIAAFANQAEGKELVGFGQGPLDPESAWAWSKRLPSIAGSLSDEYVAPGPVTRLVASWYRIGNATTASSRRVKLLTLRQRLSGGDQRAAAVLVSAERHAGQIQPEILIADFLRGSPGVDVMADRAVGVK